MSIVVNMKGQPLMLEDFGKETIDPMLADSRRKLGSGVVLRLNGDHAGIIVGRTWANRCGQDCLYDVRTDAGTHFSVPAAYIIDSKR